MRKMFSENQIRKIAGAYSDELVEIEFTENEEVKHIELENGKFYHVSLADGVNSALLYCPLILGAIWSPYNNSHILEVAGFPYEKEERYIGFQQNASLYFLFKDGIISIFATYM